MLISIEDMKKNDLQGEIKNIRGVNYVDLVVPICTYGGVQSGFNTPLLILILIHSGPYLMLLSNLFGVLKLLSWWCIIIDIDMVHDISVALHLKVDCHNFGRRPDRFSWI